MSDSLRQGLQSRGRLVGTLISKGGFIGWTEPGMEGAQDEIL
jgi:hypothetical protein